MTAKRPPGSCAETPLQVDALYGQAAQTIHNHAAVYIGCTPPNQHHQFAQSQADFKKLTGIWCPVGAQADLQTLRDKSNSPLDAWLAWRLGYIKWDEAQARLLYGINWLHVTLSMGLVIGLGYTSFYLVPVALVNAPTTRWVAVFSFFATELILLLIALELMVLRPWKVARAVRQANAEHTQSSTGYLDKHPQTIKKGYQK